MKLQISTIVAAVLFATASARGDVVISADPTQNVTCSSGVCTPTATDATLNINDLTNQLAAGDTTIVTVIGKKQDAHIIDLMVPLGWSNSSRLTLTASSHLNIAAPITVAGTGGLTITNTCTPCTTLLHNATITFQNLSSSFVVGQQAFTLVQDLPTLVADIAGQENGYYALVNDYDAHNDQFTKAPIPIFSGELNGLGHSITNLTVTHASRNCAGFVSVNAGFVRDLHLTNLTVASRQGNAGGITGCNKGELDSVAVTGTISSSGDVGGIAGFNNGGIERSRAAVSVIGNQSGGIAGENYTGGGVIALSFATGSVSGTSNAGGLVGASARGITDSYAMVAVSCSGGAAGGLTGFNNAPIDRAYSTGTATGASGFTGGFVGYDPNEQISTSYWDMDASGLDNGAGFPSGDAGIQGLTTAQFQTRLPKGFKKSIWGQSPSINNGYPYLIANPPN